MSLAYLARLFPIMDNGGGGQDIRVYYHIPKLIFGAISGALTGLFALGNLASP